MERFSEAGAIMNDELSSLERDIRCAIKCRCKELFLRLRYRDVRSARRQTCSYETSEKWIGYAIRTSSDLIIALARRNLAFHSASLKFDGVFVKAPEMAAQRLAFRKVYFHIYALIDARNQKNAISARHSSSS